MIVQTDPTARRGWIDVAMFALLVALGVLGRFAFLDTPNFTPTAAVGLFAGYYFRRKLVAALVPFLVLAISNLWLPLYASWEVGVVVFLAMLLPVALGRWLQQKTNLGRLAGAAVLPSLAFYLATNFAVWAFVGIYPHTWEGLVSCYVQAVPFYRWMLQADLLFTASLFGCYALATRLAGAKWRREPVAASA